MLISEHCLFYKRAHSYESIYFSLFFKKQILNLQGQS